MSIVAQVIAQSDNAARFLSRTELDKLDNFFKSGETRLRVAQILAQNEQNIVEEGSRRFWKIVPNTPSNSGDPNKTALCQRDQSWYLRLITYAVLAGNTKPLEDIGVDGMREMYTSLGVPVSNIGTCMRCLKEVASGMMNREEAAIAGPYFDYLIRAMY
ncbi:allophycocyanin subunit alpha-B [Chlorogloeopsis sp. ULAP01]|uniref:allophycocyanin subunit alpha-B n=1 Tax=Chlorogloeopsis sp. ULAP01 TaxID=3056483 RepID=UPI0025AAE3DD|nr:allophycocyanin subunit alpha-B [Chlorogloeopsis sp. ULAP01]MDM9385041.1 allophycocyanin subunit alpha-B [Chlorogloeopsis sp. ULAP01]